MAYFKYKIGENINRACAADSGCYKESFVENNQ